MIDKFPRITRAREYHLYDEKRRRYLDMYLDGGRAILGHRPEGVARELHAASSRGLFADYPTSFSARLEKLIGQSKGLWGAAAHVGRIYRNLDRALSIAAQWRERPLSANEPVDPALPAQEENKEHDERIVFWRPLCETPIARSSDIIIPILPFPGSWSPVIVLFPTTHPLLGDPPPSDIVSAAPLAALVRAAHNCARITSWLDLGGYRGSLPSLWKRNGPYLFAVCKVAQYEAVFNRFLKVGILLNPRFPGPTILPIIWSEGEKALFLRTSSTLTKELLCES